MSKSIEKPVVPLELNHLLDDTVLEIHERYTAMTYDQLLNFTDLTAVGSTDRDHRRYGSIMFGNEGADAEAGVLVIASSYQQAWKPSKALSARFAHDVVNPNGITIVLPNNSGDNNYYEFNDKELMKMNNGNLKPFYEKQLASVERCLGKRALGEVVFGGFSQGALVALGMASVGSDKFSVSRINSFEAPAEERTAKKLKKDFTKSGGPIDQIRAIKDAALPVLSETLRIDRLVKDYVRFGLDSSNPESKAIMTAMATPNINQLVNNALANNDDALITLGFIEGSKMLGIYKSNEDQPINCFGIGTGPGSHRHATSDNIIANALMLSVNY
jgi:hypothetical protein